MKFASFPSIEGFHNVVKLTRSYPNLAAKPIHYKGKIKLHGTNAGIRVHEGEVIAQSRTQFIDEKNDNCGFAKWVLPNKEYWKTVQSNLNTTEEITIFGEWCGPGIMKGCAIHGIENKIFAVFAIMIGGTEIELEDKNILVTEPEEIKKALGNAPKDVHVLPWFEEVGFNVDFLNDDLQAVVDVLNAVVQKTEPCDPWVKATFGVEGTAEGVVYYPSVDNVTYRKLFSNFAFKAKGEKHKVTKTKEAVQIDPEVANSIQEFVDMFVTEQRIEQGKEVVGGYDTKLTGNFLKWFNADVKKESVAELEASGLTWEDVQSAVQNKARLIFVENCKKV
jgi:hypothetical protein